MEEISERVNRISGDIEWEFVNQNYDEHQEITRSAFADMLHDSERNKKYFLALKAAIDLVHNEGKLAKVLDIGTGTGLLSIMAAQCGADSIVACEAFLPVAQCALQIIAKNNYQDKIVVIPKRSTDIIVGKDMPYKANILVTEVFDTELIGEGALETFTHAHKFLLEPNCFVVPESAVMYVQVVECPIMQRWNKLNDLYDEDMNIVLRTPNSIKSCPGSAGVHDVQLSQLSRESFKELSSPLPVFDFDWSGKTTIQKSRKKCNSFVAIDNGTAQMVFMWWELKMDSEGKILLSCAPWWHHPDADHNVQYPEDSIPWRDHWLQAIYYLPLEQYISKGQQIQLTSNHDEYSLWFHLNELQIERPMCHCAAHLAFSRTHIAYLNDGTRSKKYLKYLRDALNEKSQVVTLNGASLIGLAAASIGAKIVYIVESNRFVIEVLKKYIKFNHINNVVFIKDITEINFENLTDVICDPNFSDALLPWDNLKSAFLLKKILPRLKTEVNVLPKSFCLWLMPVEFRNLHKIKVPLRSCENIDMTHFDELVEVSRNISDDDIEPQPLWEYPCYSRGLPYKIMEIPYYELHNNYKDEGRLSLWSEELHNKKINGFTLWCQWEIGNEKFTSGGPLREPELNQRVVWDPYTRQAVKLLDKNYRPNRESFIKYSFKFNLYKGDINIVLSI